MARAGASKSLDKPASKARGGPDAAAKVPATSASKTTRKKPEPVGVAPKPTATPKPKALPAKAAKAVKSKAVAVAKPAKAVKAAKPAVKAAKAVKTPPAKAVNVKTKAAPAAKQIPTKKNSEVPVAEAAKAKRAATATKPKAVAAPVSAVATDASGGFPAKTLDKLRRLLEEERETYLRQARDLAAEAEALASEREPGDTQFDEESGEGDTLNVERERDLALSASATQAVEEIDRALRRMDTGSYGICERCGRKITVARLEALPFAALCIECKSREERRR
jgi:RNA polymerase-binding protein DksA